MQFDKPLHYRHHGIDPIHTDGRSVDVGGHADPKVALITTSDAHTALYVHQDQVASVIVALITGTGFLDRTPESEGEKALIDFASSFVDTFREGLIPQFREKFQSALNEAESDWDLKCRMARIVAEYEGLR